MKIEWEGLNKERAYKGKGIYFTSQNKRPLVNIPFERYSVCGVWRKSLFELESIQDKNKRTAENILLLL